MNEDERPDFGTCGRCGVPGPINASGYRRPHVRKEYRGSMVLTIRCANYQAPEFIAWREATKT